MIIIYLIVNIVFSSNSIDPLCHIIPVSIIIVIINDIFIITNFLFKLGLFDSFFKIGNFLPDSPMQISLHAMNMIMQVLSKSGQQIGHNSSALLVLKMALLHKGNAYHAALLQLLVLQLRENSRQSLWVVVFNELGNAWGIGHVTFCLGHFYQYKLDQLPFKHITEIESEVDSDHCLCRHNPYVFTRPEFIG